MNTHAIRTVPVPAGGAVHVAVTLSLSELSMWVTEIYKRGRQVLCKSVASVLKQLVHKTANGQPFGSTEKNVMPCTWPVSFYSPVCENDTSVCYSDTNGVMRALFGAIECSTVFV